MKRRSVAMTKQLFSLFFSLGIAAFLAAACHAPALEEIQFPKEQETEVVPERTTIPYSLTVNTEQTRVSYNGTSYQFKAGDKIHVTGTGDRTDIVGDLEQGENNLWTGDLSYLTVKEPPVNGVTELEATLIHADNTDTTTYATALVGSGSIEGYVPETDLLQHAVENYSLFTAQFKFGTQEPVTLKQQATFLDLRVKFVFDGTHEVEAGNALVDLRTIWGETTGRTVFFPEANGKDFRVHFVAVIPGDQAIDQFTITIGDRAVAFTYDVTNPPTLERNKKYTVTRDIVYGPQLGDPFWSDGTYGRFDHASTGASIVGIIVYVNHNYTPGTDEAAIDDAITEKADGFGHGLVMALHNAAEMVAWSATKGTQCTSSFVTKPAETLVAGKLSGYENTLSIISTLGSNVNSAASIARNYGAQVATTNTTGTKVTTGWFLPSIGQWLYTISIDGFGGADHADNWTDNGKPPKNWLTNPSCTLENSLVRVMSNNDETNNYLVNSLNNRLEQLKNDFQSYNCEYDSFGISKDNASTINYSDNYWSSSERNEDQAIRMNFGSVEEGYATIKAKPEDKKSTYFLGNQRYVARVRPFLAF